MTQKSIAQKSNGLRRKAEKLLSQRDSNIGKMTTEDVKMVHELQVHQIELEMQNEELRKAQKEIEDFANRRRGNNSQFGPEHAAPFRIQGYGIK